MQSQKLTQFEPSACSLTIEILVKLSLMVVKAVSSVQRKWDMQCVFLSLQGLSCSSRAHNLLSFQVGVQSLRASTLVASQVTRVQVSLCLAKTSERTRILEQDSERSGVMSKAMTRSPCES